MQEALFLIRTWLISTAVCLGLVALLGDLPAATWAVLFPMLTMLAVLVADWLEKHVEISIAVKK